jgi:hypothetical protein
VDAEAVDPGHESLVALGGHLGLEGHEEEVGEGWAEVGAVEARRAVRVGQRENVLAARAKELDGVANVVTQPDGQRGRALAKVAE